MNDDEFIHAIMADKKVRQEMQSIASEAMSDITEPTAENKRKETIGETITALRELCPTVEKNHTYSIGGNQIKYASFEDIMRAIREPATEVGLTIEFGFVLLGNEQEQVITLRVANQDGGSSSHMMRLDADSKDPKKIGSQITYFKRYMLTTVLGIGGADDDTDGQDTADAHPAPEKSLLQINKLIEETGADAGQVLNYVEQRFGVGTFGELNRRQASTIVKILEAKKKEKKDGTKN